MLEAPAPWDVAGSPSVNEPDWARGEAPVPLEARPFRMGRTARRPVLAATAAMLALLSACGPAAPEGRPTGAVNVAVVASSGGPALTRVHVAAEPAGSAADLVLESGAWRGTLTVHANVAQTLTATAYAGTEEVGSGAATLTVAQHQTASAAILILDTSDRPAPADHGPIIASLTASAAPLYAAPVTLAASAADPDGDPLEYAWSASCAGSFSAATSPSTDWTPLATGACTVTAAVSSRSVTRTSALALTVTTPVPQLTIVEDAGYPATNDPRSTYPYLASAADYATLGTTATTVFGTTDKHVRLVRYVVSNPGPLPVAIDAIAVSSAWRLSESWASRAAAAPAGESALGTTCPSLAGEELGYVLTPSCAVGEVYSGVLGPESADMVCEPAMDAGSTYIAATNSAIGRSVSLDAAGVEGAAARKVGPRTVVPAASGGMPGRVALYLSRPLVNRVDAPSWSGSEWIRDESVWAKASVPPGPMDCPEGWPGEWDAVWDLYVRPERLQAANDVLVGEFPLTAYTMNTAGTAVIGAATPITRVVFTRVIGH